MKNDNKLSELVDNRIREAGLTMRDFSQGMYVSPSTAYCYVRRPETMPIRALQQMIKLLNLSSSDVFTLVTGGLW